MAVIRTVKSIRAAIFITLGCFLLITPVPSRSKELSKPVQTLYADALVNYTNIAYMMHRDTQRASMALKTAVATFLAQPENGNYARLKLSVARLYGAYLRTLYIYYDDAGHEVIRGRLLPPDAPGLHIAAPYDAVFQETFDAAVVPPLLTQESLEGYRERAANPPPVEVMPDDEQSDPKRSLPVKEAGVVEGFGAMRAALRVPAEFYAGYTDAVRVRRGFLQLATDNAVNDIRTLLSSYRPDDDNTGTRLLALPAYTAWQRISVHMRDSSKKIASGFRVHTPEAKQYGDITNILSGIRAFITGSYGRLHGPGLAALALSVGTDRAGFLNFAFGRVYSATPVFASESVDEQASDMRENWRALAESLNLFK